MGVLLVGMCRAATPRTDFCFQLVSINIKKLKIIKTYNFEAKRETHLIWCVCVLGVSRKRRRKENTPISGVFYVFSWHAQNDDEQKNPPKEVDFSALGGFFCPSPTKTCCKSLVSK